MSTTRPQVRRARPRRGAPGQNPKVASRTGARAGVEPLEGRVLLAAATLSNGAGENTLRITVDPYGSYTNAVYDPVGASAAANTTFFSAVYFSPGGNFLTEEHVGPLQFDNTTASSAVSSFSHSGLSITLTQTVAAAGAGAVDFIQQYQITNTTASPVTLQLVRHVDGDLAYAPGVADTAGVSKDGRTLYEFDTADPNTAAGMFSVSNTGGTHVGYAIRSFKYDDNIVAAGGIPTADLNTVEGDANADRLTDAGYDVTMSLQNSLTIAPDTSQTFATTTRFGQGAPLTTVGVTLPGPEQDTTFADINVDFATEAMATQSDGKLIMAGHRVTGGVPQAVMQRFNVDGTPDATFGNGGVFQSPAGSDDEFYGLGIASDDRIVASGRSGGDFLVARFTAAGAPDTAFGGTGRVTTSFDDLGGGSDIAWGIDFGPGGTVVVGGGANGKFAFARYTAAGALDPTFGVGGRRRFDIGTTNDAIADLAVQSDGKVIVAGAGGLGGASVLVARMLPNGEPDLTFGGGTVVLAVPGLSARTDLGQTDRTQGLAIDANDRILIANRTPDGNFGVVRLNPNGTADTTFGTSGLATADFGGDDDADAITVQGNGRGEIVVVGTTGSGAAASIAIAAFTPEGAPVASFGSGGKVVQDSGLPDAQESVQAGAFPGGYAPQSFRSGELRRQALATVQPRTRRLVTGASDQTDTESRSAFSRVLVPGSANETVIGSFGTVTGQRKPQAFAVPNTRLRITLTGGGTGQVVTDSTKPGLTKLVLTGTTARSALGVKGAGRLPVSDLAVDGPVARIAGKTIDLSGTLFVNGAVNNIALGNVSGTPTAPATVATSGSIRSLSALTLVNARVLSGNNFGADGLQGGGDDAVGEGRIRALKVAGPITASFVGAGVNPINGIFGDTDDRAVGGAASRIDKVAAKGGVDAASIFSAGSFGNIRKLGRERITIATDPRFRVLPA